MDTKDTFIDTLQRIRSIALAKATNIHKFASCSKSSTAVIPDLSLPSPQDITSALLNIGCPSPSLAKAVSDSYCRRGNEIRGVYLENHKSSCQKALQLLAFDSGALTSYQRLIPTLENNYKKELSSLREGYIESVRKKFAAQQPQPLVDDSAAKGLFNQDFLPVLEKWFETNPYPNAEQRAVLARKSKMTPRQIEVWFQNHRTRAKKEGKTVQKSTRMSSSPIPRRSSQEPICSSASEEERENSSTPTLILPLEDTQHHEVRPTTPPSETESNPLTPSNIPAYVFPLPYKPRRQERTTLPPPVWYRLPAKSSSPTSMRKIKKSDIDSLCADMVSKLHFRNSPKKIESEAPHTSSSPWFTSIVTLHTPAPHPALISTPSIPEKPMPRPKSRFSSPKFGSSSSLQPPSLITASSSSPRKLVRVPKRSPKSSRRSVTPNDPPSPRSTYRSWTPSCFSSSPSLRRESSDSSLSSTSSRRRLSTSSGSSVASSVIHTPDLGQVDLPVSIVHPQIAPSTPDEPPDCYSMLNFSPSFYFPYAGKVNPTLNVISTAFESYLPS